MYYPTDPIKNLKGVGEYLENRLKTQGIATIGDLLNYFPFRYEDLSIISKIKDLNTQSSFVLKGQFKNIVPIKSKTGRQMITGKFFDETGVINVLWFNSTFILRTIKENEFYTVSGKPSFYLGKPNIVNPNFEISNDTSTNYGRIVPIYFNIPFVTMRTLRKLIYEAVEKTQIQDFLKENLLTVDRGQLTVKQQTESEFTAHHLLPTDYLNLKETYRNLHFPSSFETIEKAKDRIALNELIHVKLHSEKTKQIVQKYKSKLKLKKTYNKIFQSTLPFKLTVDQKSSITKISKLLKKEYPANALLSGDVGSGKTIVAINTSLNVLKNGGKVLYLAPTLVLAEQIFQEFNKCLLNPKLSTINYKLLTRLVTSKTKKLSSEELLETNILIGTHTLLNIPEIENFAHLVIIDEQHKFGVKQRAKLIEGKNPPHLITMTATPIPRSLALAYFNEMDLIQIKHKPKNRLPVVTKVLEERKRTDCYKWLKNNVLKSQKAFVIVPFIEKSASEDFENIKSVEQVEKELVKFFGVSSVTTLHGKLKNDEKTKIMENFRNKKGGILLSTQVIEVGIDIKEATVIIIESAERFGLASLHQLRGRVGRNDLKSYCFLFTSSGKSNERLKTLEREQNGFRLALFDLKNRGGGEIFGIRQSGEIDLRFVDFSKNQIIKEAGIIAKNIYNDQKLFKSYRDNFFTRDIFDIKDN